MSLSRLLSLIVVGLYLFAIFFPYLTGESDDKLLEVVGLRAIIWLILSLACIWFGDEMGEYMGWAGHGMITSPSPGGLVKFMGWLLLVLPGLIFIFVEVIYKK